MKIVGFSSLLSDPVFKYTLAGKLLESWAIDPANSHPTGITINPTNVSDIWIVDSGTLKVYQYTGAATRTSGSQTAAATFALAPGDANAQGIADQPSQAGAAAAQPAESPTVLTVATAPTLDRQDDDDFDPPVTAGRPGSDGAGPGANRLGHEANHEQRDATLT